MFSRWRATVFVGTMVVGAGIVGFSISGARAANETTSLDVNPSTVEGRTLSLADPIFVQVRLKAGEYDLADIALSTFSNDDIATTVEGAPSAAQVAQLPSNAEHAWMLRLVPAKGNALEPAARTVNITVAFKEGKDPSRQTLQQHYLSQTIKIAAPPAVTTPTLADIDIKGSLDSLSHERPGRLFVIVTNKYSEGLHLTDAQIYGPKFISIEGPGAKEFQSPALSELSYGGTRVLAYDVRAPDQVVPGKYPVVVVVSMAALDGVTASIAKTQDIELAVLGESDLLNKIGAPSLLFLPGVLFLLSWQLLWSFGKGPQQRQTYSMTPTGGTFWVVAVAISLIFAFVYPRIVLLIAKEHRDYLAGYGLKDFLYVFSLTIVSACAIYVFWLFLQWLAGRYHVWLLWRTTPSADDQPLTILRKLGRLRRGTVLRQAHAADGNADQRVLILEPWREPAYLWVVPPATLQLTAQAPALALNYAQEIQNGQITDARQIVRQVKKGMRWWRRLAGRQWWSIAWRPVGNVARPRKGRIAEWTELQSEGRLVEVP